MPTHVLNTKNIEVAEQGLAQLLQTVSPPYNFNPLRCNGLDITIGIKCNMDPTT